MNRNIRNIIILSSILLLISTFIIIIFGNTYTLTFKTIEGRDYKLSIENELGEIKILNKKEKDGYYYLKVKSKKPGKVFIRLDYKDIQETSLLYIHKNGIITDNTYFGKSTASEVIPISISIVCLYSLYLLINKYRKSVKENIYQYKNIALLGIILFLSFFTISNIFSIYNYRGLFDTINKSINTMAGISTILFPISFVTFILVTISNINLIKKEGLSPKNLLGLFLGIIICVLTKLPDKVYTLILTSGNINIYNLNSPGPYIYNYLEALLYLSVSYLEFILVATIIIAIKAVKKKVPFNKDYMIILGCRVNKDGSLPPLLRGRVDKALEFRNNQLSRTGKDLIFIPSGGKGLDEELSEGEAIHNYLKSKDINEEKIIVENKSKNTYENIKYSMKKIKNKKANIAFSTTNYHVLRAGLIATNQGLLIDGIGSNTKSYFWINAFIREFIGTIYSERKKHIVTFIFISIVLIIMVGITYLGNNI